MGVEEIQKLDNEAALTSESSSTLEHGSPTATPPPAVLIADEKHEVPAPPVHAHPHIPPPPNGGTLAWLQVLGSFFLFFNSWGTVNTYGAFQTYYEEALLKHESASNISWVGSIQAFLLLFIGTVTGPAYDAGYFRTLLWCGAFLVPFGFMMTSISTQYWQVMLAQGVCIGLGNGSIFIPSVAILPQYFSTRKALANGIAATGSSLGGVIYPIVFHKLVPQIGFGWSVRVLGFISLATLIVPLSVMRVRVMPKQKRKLVQLSAFKDPPFSLYSIAMFIGFIGFYGPIFYVQVYAIQKRIMSENLAFYLVPILNSASIPGRIVPNFLADRFGPLNVLLPASVVTGTLALAWIGIKSTPSLIIFALLYGFFSGGFVSLPPVTMVTLTPDIRDLGTRMSMCFTCTAMGLLVGTPVSGAILGSGDNYLGLQLFSGVLLIVTGILLVVTRISKSGLKVKVRV